MCCVFSLLIFGCSHTTVTRTIADSISKSGNNIDSLQLNPKFRYLRVTVNHRSALLVLGYTENYKEGNVEIWYSDSGQVLRLQNGRVLGTVGLETDWLNVNYVSLPSWGKVTQNQSISYQRKRDQMPGYRFGISESLTISPIPPPTDSEIVPISYKQLKWYQEVSSGQSDSSKSARYAVLEKNGDLKVVYSDQCLSEKFCLSWQLWPSAD